MKIPMNIIMRCRTEFSNQSRIGGRVDTELQKQIEEEIDYWRSVLHRVVAVVKKLSSHGLAFRGKNEKFGDNHNGNFMMCLELIAEFNPFLSTHIATPGKGKTSYLSSTTCNEFISMIAAKVMKTIVAEIKNSKYFSIIVDSTADISHIDELSLVIRYVTENGTPVERFLRCFQYSYSLWIKSARFSRTVL